MKKDLRWMLMAAAMAGLLTVPAPARAQSLSDYSLMPPFVSSGAPPLVMLVMGRDHKLYYEAYNDISDLDGDGLIDVGYKPSIDYYGYFDSYKEYVYDAGDGRFEPVAVTADKKVSAAGRWSGDYLNYLTTSRMDALRKVLYGGFRGSDSTTDTTLQRVYIPQDAHTWGKQYESIAKDGYDIRDYTPLALPDAERRHMFASTTLSANGTPVLRVLPNNPGYVWEWVAKERPVADDSLETAGTSDRYDSHPNNHTEFEDLVTQFATADHLQCSVNPARINGSGNPCGWNDYYLTIFTGTIDIQNAGTYQFAVDGDDAVEVIIDGTVVAGWYGGHGSCDCDSHSGAIDLSAGVHNVEFRHQERTGGDSYKLRWYGPDSGNRWRTVSNNAFKVPGTDDTSLTQTVYDVELSSTSSTITDYDVRVQVCLPSMPEDNCKLYPSGNYKPIGILQRHGEAEAMYFGLLTGSYTKNTSGGVLRKNVGPITDEIDGSTGQFLGGTNGIIQTINKLRTDGFTYSGYSYNESCGWITTRPINEGECRMWSNPVGEMMYESLRYFSGAGAATSAFTYGTDSGYDDNQLGLPKPAWKDPYNTTDGYPGCAKPFMLVLSDVNPSFDSDQLPGSLFGSFTGDASGPMNGLNVEDLADTISSDEQIAGPAGTGKKYYIGEIWGDTTNAGAPTPKTVTSLADIRGLAPEEPTKQGSYYSASVAYYGRKTDINDVDGLQNVVTYSVALSSPLPRIEIPFPGGKMITLIPYAKSVGGSSISASSGSFQPTNTIVDVFMQQLSPTYGKFRVNFEDVEQGADHDMDAIVEYVYQLVNSSGVSVTDPADATGVKISLDSQYAAGGIIQHMGYVISGTTADGTYLVVRDADTSSGSDPDYFLDVTPTGSPGSGWSDGEALPLQSERTFAPGTTETATLLKNPLWYAAKWGGYEEPAGLAVSKPDLQDEWDKDGDGTPDTYFYVTNPLRLEEQLNKSFADILRRTASGTAASVISSSRSGEGAVYQSVFFPELSDQSGESVNWIGQTHALFVDSHGNMREDTNGNGQLDLKTDKLIVFDVDADGSTFVKKFTDANGDEELQAGEASGGTVAALADTKFIWSSSSWLNEIADSNILLQRTYNAVDTKRYIFTFIDDGDMVAESGETLDFLASQASILPYIHALPPFDATVVPAELGTPGTGNTLWQDFLSNQRQRVVKFIRGVDQGSFTSTTSPSYSLPAMRSRKLDYDDDGAIETWRMGDIVYSSPTVVATPAEDFDLLYDDASYTAFYKKWVNRRHMVYVGANDGMLHAFNGGFYDRKNKKFAKGADFGDSGMPLGAEMWAYVPFNLLPHLYWLTDPGYDTDSHVAYVDLKPRIFDAKVFPADPDHPNGWGTILVCGMRFGGGALPVDTNGDNSAANEPVMSSAYIVMDVTNPEVAPKLLAELRFPNQGFTTAVPTVVALRDRGANSSPETNKWYLVFGSGPHDTLGAFGNALANGTSNQAARIYAVDLHDLVFDKQLKSLNASGAPTAGANTLASLDSASFVSDPVTVDYDFDYRADAVYFGTMSGGFAGGFGGKLRRIVVGDDVSAANWDADSVLIDLGSVYNGQPISTAPAVGKTDYGDFYIYFGTGRFLNRTDVNNLTRAADPQSYYGIKEPYTLVNGEKVLSWATVTRSDLLDVSSAEVFEEGKTVTGIGGFSGDFDDLEDMMDAPVGDAKYQGGWYLDFATSKERNLGQPTLLGNILTFTTYVPSADACEEGYSNLYAPFYKTGTGYKHPVIGTDATNTVDDDMDGDGTTETTHQEVLRKTKLGQGLTLTPNLHIGREAGAKAFLQTSTSAIITIEQDAPGRTKSGASMWKQE